MPYRDRAKQNAYQSEWMKKRCLKWLEENGPCVDCQSWNSLEVDHVDPTQKVAHRVWSWSAQRRLEELAKCVVRCHECHVLKGAINGEYANEFIRKGGARLSVEKVRQAKALRKEGLTYRAIANLLGIGQTTVRFICQGKSWKSVQ